MMYPLVTDLAQAKGAQVRVPVAVSCRVLGFSRQAYYQWLADPVCQRDWDDAHLINAAIDLHAADPGLGYRLIADDLPDIQPQDGFSGGTPAQYTNRMTTLVNNKIAELAITYYKQSGAILEARQRIEAAITVMLSQPIPELALMIDEAKELIEEQGE